MSRPQDYYAKKVWRETRKLGAGVMTNKGGHHIDVLFWTMGNLENVMTKATTSLVNIEAADPGIAILKFGNGAFGITEATTATRPKDLNDSISILGEKGSAEISVFFMSELKTWNFIELNEMDLDILYKHARMPNQPAWNHTEFCKDILWSLNGETRALIDDLGCRKSVELINTIYETNKTGKEVSLRFSPNESRLGVRQ